MQPPSSRRRRRSSDAEGVAEEFSLATAGDDAAAADGFAQDSPFEAAGALAGSGDPAGAGADAAAGAAAWMAPAGYSGGRDVGWRMAEHGGRRGVGWGETPVWPPPRVRDAVTAAKRRHLALIQATWAGRTQQLAAQARALRAASASLRAIASGWLGSLHPEFSPEPRPLHAVAGASAVSKSGLKGAAAAAAVSAGGSAAAASAAPFMWASLRAGGMCLPLHAHAAISRRARALVRAVEFVAFGGPADAGAADTRSGGGIVPAASWLGYAADLDCASATAASVPTASAAWSTASADLDCASAAAASSSTASAAWSTASAAWSTPHRLAAALAAATGSPAAGSASLRTLSAVGGRPRLTDVRGAIEAAYGRRSTGAAEPAEGVGEGGDDGDVIVLSSDEPPALNPAELRALPLTAFQTSRSSGGGAFVGASDGAADGCGGAQSGAAVTHGCDGGTEGLAEEEDACGVMCDDDGAAESDEARSRGSGPHCGTPGVGAGRGARETAVATATEGVSLVLQWQPAVATNLRLTRTQGGGWALRWDAAGAGGCMNGASAALHGDSLAWRVEWVRITPEAGSAAASGAIAAPAAATPSAAAAGTASRKAVVTTPKGRPARAASTTRRTGGSHGAGGSRGAMDAIVHGDVHRPSGFHAEIIRPSDASLLGAGVASLRLAGEQLAAAPSAIRRSGSSARRSGSGGGGSRTAASGGIRSGGTRSTGSFWGGGSAHERVPTDGEAKATMEEEDACGIVAGSQDRALTPAGKPRSQSVREALCDGTAELTVTISGCDVPISAVCEFHFTTRCIELSGAQMQHALRQGFVGCRVSSVLRLPPAVVAAGVPPAATAGAGKRNRLTAPAASTPACGCADYRTVRGHTHNSSGSAVAGRRASGGASVRSVSGDQTAVKADPARSARAPQAMEAEPARANRQSPAMKADPGAARRDHVTDAAAAVSARSSSAPRWVPAVQQAAVLPADDSSDGARATAAGRDAGAEGGSFGSSCAPSSRPGSCGAHRCDGECTRAGDAETAAAPTAPAAAADCPLVAPLVLGRYRAGDAVQVDWRGLYERHRDLAVRALWAPQASTAADAAAADTAAGAESAGAGACQQEEGSARGSDAEETKTESEASSESGAGDAAGVESTYALQAALGATAMCTLQAGLLVALGRTDGTIALLNTASRRVRVLPSLADVAQDSTVTRLAWTSAAGASGSDAATLGNGSTSPRPRMAVDEGGSDSDAGREAACLRSAAKSGGRTGSTSDEPHPTATEVCSLTACGDRLLAAGYRDGCVVLWNTDTRTLLHRLPGCQACGAVAALLHLRSASGLQDQLVAGTEAGHLLVWSLDTPQRLHGAYDTWPGRQPRRCATSDLMSTVDASDSASRPSSAHASRPEETGAGAVGAAGVAAGDGEHGSADVSPQLGAGITCLAVTPGHWELVVGCQDGSVDVWDVQHWRRKHGEGQGGKQGGKEGQGGTRDDTGILRLRGVLSRLFDDSADDEPVEVVALLPLAPTAGTAESTSGGGQRVLAGYTDGTLRLWSLSARSEEASLHAFSGVSSMAQLADGRVAVAYSDCGRVDLYDVQAWAGSARPPAGAAGASTSSAARAGASVRTSGSAQHEPGSDDEEAEAASAGAPATLMLPLAADGRDCGIHTLAALPDGRLLACGMGKQLGVWGLPALRPNAGTR